jgi:dihydrodipicolinate reductase
MDSLPGHLKLHYLFSSSNSTKPISQYFFSHFHSVCTMSVFKKIAIVGALGDLGKHITAAILAEGDRFDLTLITRKSGKQAIPVGAKVVELNDYSESDELTQALTGQDVLMSFHNTAAAPGGTVSVSLQSPVRYIANLSSFKRRHEALSNGCTVC